jgi:hypothetical protein
MADEPTSNPLAEAKPQSLDEIFSSDPLGLGEREFETVIRALREEAARWAIAEAAGKRSAPKVPKEAAKPGLSLDDLGL